MAFPIFAEYGANGVNSASGATATLTTAGTFSPSPYSMLLVFTSSFISAGSPSVPSSFSGGGLTYLQPAGTNTQTYSLTARSSVHYALCGESPGTFDVTATWSANQQTRSIAVFEVRNYNRAAPFAQNVAGATGSGSTSPMVVTLGGASSALNAVFAYFVTAAGRTGHTEESNYTPFGPYEFASGGDHFGEYRVGAAESNAECATTGTGIWSAFMLEIATDTIPEQPYRFSEGPSHVLVPVGAVAY